MVTAKSTNTWEDKGYNGETAITVNFPNFYGNFTEVATGNTNYKWNNTVLDSFEFVDNMSSNGQISLMGGALNFDTGKRHSYIEDIPIATANTHGTVRVGSGLSIDATTGVLSASSSSYTLPIAGTSMLGGVFIGDSMSMSVSGVLDYKYSRPYPSVITTLNLVSANLGSYNVYYALLSANSTLTISATPIEDWDYIVVIKNINTSAITITLSNTVSGVDFYAPGVTFIIEADSQVELSFRYHALTSAIYLVWSPELIQI
jgi:hypothetical protein